MACGTVIREKALLVGGFKPFEKYESKWESSGNRGENNKYLKPPSLYIVRPIWVPVMIPTLIPIQ